MYSIENYMKIDLDVGVKFIDYVKNKLELSNLQLNNYMQKQGFGDIVKLDTRTAEEMSHWVKANLGIDWPPHMFWMGSLNNIRNRIVKKCLYTRYFESGQHTR